ncbi:MAG: response regulator [Thermodesulfobacteriota bacterium]|nr:response regulator [Thermodesulfobacteriota bacterium]
MTDEASKNHTILLVDDESQVLNSLKRLFRKEKQYAVYTAASGQEGLSRLKEMETPVSLIVSDQRMPGMSGSEFLEQAKALCPDAIRFMLTGYSDLNAIVDAVNKGEIHRYITKPWNDDDLKLQIRQAIRQYELVEENKRLQEVTKQQNIKLYKLGRNLEKKVQERTAKLTEKYRELEFLNKELEFNLFNTVRAFAAIMDVAIPHLKGHGKRVGAFARDVAVQLNMPEDEMKDIDIASLLHDIGKIGSPSSVISKTPKNMDDETLARYKKHPAMGQQVVAFIPRLESVGQIIRHHHERFDGKGFPDGLSEDAIPLGARIVSVTDSYDMIISLGTEKNAYVSAYLKSRDIANPDMETDELLKQAAIHHIKVNAFSAFDPDVVKSAIEVLKGRGTVLKAEKDVDVTDLVPGMTISRTLYTNSGRFLLPYHTVLTTTTIDKLKAIHNNDAIGTIYVEEK